MKAFSSLLVLLLLLFLVGAASGVSRGLLVLTNGEWPPYFSPGCRDGGIGSKICQRAFALEGVDVKYVYLPWKRALDLVRQGKSDGSFGWVSPPEGERDFLISDTVVDTDVVFFHRMANNFDWINPGDIGQYRIGGTLGYAYLKDLRPVVREGGGSLEIAPIDTLNFMKLAQGRIDLFPCAREVGLYLIWRELVPSVAAHIRYHPRPLVSGGLHLLLSRTLHDAALMQRFNHGLHRLHETGEYDHIMHEGLCVEPHSEDE